MSDFFWLNPCYEDEPEPILREVFSDWAAGGGIFSALGSLDGFTMPWNEDPNVSNEILDIEYFGNHSGSKFCSPIIKYLVNDDGVLESTAISTLAKIIATKYLKNWQRLWTTNTVAYSAIDNYRLSITRELDSENANDRSLTNEDTHTGTDTLTLNTNETRSHGKTDDTTTYQFGFNSTSTTRDPSQMISEREGGSTGISNTGTETQTKNLVDSTERTVSDTGTGHEYETITRSGKIGDTTTQKILEEERNLWLWNYFKTIYKNIDEELTLFVYDPCRV